MQVMEPVDYPRGSSYVCFDASPLIEYVDAGRLAELAGWFSFGTCFTAQVILDVEIPRGLANHPANQEILDAAWLQRAVVLEDDFEFIVELRELWGSPGDRDYGEAEVVALCKRYGWTAVMNDGRGRAAARRHEVSSVCTGSLLVAATAEGIIGNEAAWELHRALEEDFDSPMILPTTDEYRPAFDRAVRAVKQWTSAHQDTHWPATIAMEPRLDDILGRAVAAVQ